MAGVWGMSPKQSIEAECSRRGRTAVLSGCVALLAGEGGDDDLLVALAGPAAHQVLAGREGGREGYWPRVWAARGLLYVWEPSASATVVDALSDESWRVRELAAKVVRRHRVDEALDAVARLQQDPVARVRAAAGRAVEAIVGGDPP